MIPMVLLESGLWHSLQSWAALPLPLTLLLAPSETTGKLPCTSTISSWLNRPQAPVLVPARHHRPLRPSSRPHCPHASDGGGVTCKAGAVPLLPPLAASSQPDEDPKSTSHP